jgi:hypothetical protein
MTIAEATTDEHGTDTGLDDIEENNRVEAGSVLTGQEGEEAADSSEVEAAMEAGWKRANDPDGTEGDEPNNGDGDEGTPQQGTTVKTQAPAKTTQPDDPEVTLRASELAQFRRDIEAANKTASTVAGNVGHLKTLVTKAGEGRPITKESLTHIREEFGDEYAEALAKDLSSAGFGSGAGVDPEVVSRMVSEQVEKVSGNLEQRARKLELVAVKRAHPDALDYFAGGKHHTDFAAFVGSLPAERQQVLATSWDAEDNIGALDEFKSYRDKAAKAATQQERRTSRAALPTGGAGAVVGAPATDPLVEGWNRAGGSRSGGRRK